ncbi:hypothetical protein WJX72_002160 [[Myrmecia] bisecta]|uniref:Uncharacterized protein n=1 Tax=[Myrmecia] bisecta TaxID=41462 RepID=A0AAW1Q8M8_9CHLO
MQSIPSSVATAERAENVAAQQTEEQPEAPQRELTERELKALCEAEAPCTARNIQAMYLRQSNALRFVALLGRLPPNEARRLRTIFSGAFVRVIHNGAYPRLCEVKCVEGEGAEAMFVLRNEDGLKVLVLALSDQELDPHSPELEVLQMRWLCKEPPQLEPLKARQVARVHLRLSIAFQLDLIASDPLLTDTHIERTPQWQHLVGLLDDLPMWLVIQRVETMAEARDEIRAIQGQHAKVQPRGALIEAQLRLERASGALSPSHGRRSSSGRASDHGHSPRANGGTARTAGEPSPSKQRASADYGHSPRANGGTARTASEPSPSKPRASADHGHSPWADRGRARTADEPSPSKKRTSEASASHTHSQGHLRSPSQGSHSGRDRQSDRDTTRHRKRVHDESPGTGKQGSEHGHDSKQRKHHGSGGPSSSGAGGERAAIDADRVQVTATPEGHRVEAALRSTSSRPADAMETVPETSVKLKASGAQPREALVERPVAAQAATFAPAAEAWAQPDASVSYPVAAYAQAYAQAYPAGQIQTPDGMHWLQDQWWQWYYWGSVGMTQQWLPTGAAPYLDMYGQWQSPSYPQQVAYSAPAPPAYPATSSYLTAAASVPASAAAYIEPPSAVDPVALAQLQAPEVPAACTDAASTAPPPCAEQEPSADVPPGTEEETPPVDTSTWEPPPYSPTKADQEEGWPPARPVGSEWLASGASSNVLKAEVLDSAEVCEASEESWQARLRCWWDGRVLVFNAAQTAEVAKRVDQLKRKPPPVFTSAAKRTFYKLAEVLSAGEQEETVLALRFCAPLNGEPGAPVRRFCLLLLVQAFAVDLNFYLSPERCPDYHAALEEQGHAAGKRAAAAAAAALEAAATEDEDGEDVPPPKRSRWDSDTETAPDGQAAAAPACMELRQTAHAADSGEGMAGPHAVDSRPSTGSTQASDGRGGEAAPGRESRAEAQAQGGELCEAGLAKCDPEAQEVVRGMVAEGQLSGVGELSDAVYGNLSRLTPRQQVKLVDMLRSRLASADAKGPINNKSAWIMKGISQGLSHLEALVDGGADPKADPRTPPTTSANAVPLGAASPPGASPPPRRPGSAHAAAGGSGNRGPTLSARWRHIENDARAVLVGLVKKEAIQPNDISQAAVDAIARLPADQQQTLCKEARAWLVNTGHARKVDTYILDNATSMLAAQVGWRAAKEARLPKRRDSGGRRASRSRTRSPPRARRGSRSRSRSRSRERSRRRASERKGRSASPSRHRPDPRDRRRSPEPDRPSGARGSGRSPAPVRERLTATQQRAHAATVERLPSDTQKILQELVKDGTLEHATELDKSALSFLTHLDVKDQCAAMRLLQRKVCLQNKSAWLTRHINTLR